MSLSKHECFTVGGMFYTSPVNYFMYSTVPLFLLNLCNIFYLLFQDPYRTFPRAVVVGLMIVTGFYFLTNIAYLSVMPLDVLLKSPAVAAVCLHRKD